VEVLPFVLAALRSIHYHVASSTGGRISRERLLHGVVDLFIAGLARPHAEERGARKGPRR
jgi:hypothetical protein